MRVTVPWPRCDLRSAVEPAHSAAPAVTTGSDVTSMSMLIQIASVRSFHPCMNLESGDRNFICVAFVGAGHNLAGV